MIRKIINKIKRLRDQRREIIILAQQVRDLEWELGCLLDEIDIIIHGEGKTVCSEMLKSLVKEYRKGA